MKRRCPVCNGSGGVEPTFGTGVVYGYGFHTESMLTAKVCPACDGTGMQDEQTL